MDTISLEFTLFIQGNINYIYSQPTLEFTSLPNKEQPEIKKVTKEILLSTFLVRWYQVNAWMLKTGKSSGNQT